MKKVYTIATILLIVLGVGHTILTPAFYPEFSQDAVWFAGTGLAVLFLGLLNTTALLFPRRAILNLCLAANVIGTAYSGLIIAVVPEIQAFIAVGAFLLATVGAVHSRFNIANAIA